jgi:hypothetical protein
VQQLVARPTSIWIAHLMMSTEILNGPPSVKCRHRFSPMGGQRESIAAAKS